MRYLILIILAISVSFTANSQTSSIDLAILGTANTVINQIGNSNINSSVFLTNQTTENELQFALGCLRAVSFRFQLEFN